MRHIAIKPQLRAVPFMVMFLSMIGGFGHSQTVTPFYNFTNQNGSGFPQDVALIQGRDSNLYGMSYGSPDGSIFKLSTSRVFTNLFAFSFTDGCCPGEGLTLASDGNFYGGTSGGGIDQNGVFFKMTASGVFTAIHYFTGGTDGSHPFTPPVEASDGSLYAVAQSVVYKYVPSSGSFSTILSVQQWGRRCAFNPGL